MKILKPLFFSAVSRVPLSWLTKKVNPVVLIPYQHLVSDEPVPYIRNLYAFKNVRQFEADVDYLLRNFEPVSLTDIIKHQNEGRSFSKTSFLLTFDDGLRQVYDTVMPVLARKGVPAALFLNPAFVDNKELFYDIKKGLIFQHLHSSSVSLPLIRKIGQSLGQRISTLKELYTLVQSINYQCKQQADVIGTLLDIDFSGFVQQYAPFMTTDQIKTCIRNGFQAGAHSIDHPLYRNIPLEEQIRQTKESVNWVCERFNLPYRSFAFPHVDEGVSDAFFSSLLHDEHFRLDMIMGNRTGMAETHHKVLHRFIGENPLLPAETMVKAVLSYQLMRKTFGLSAIKRS